jgi:hypothetical protein
MIHISICTDASCIGEIRTSRRALLAGWATQMDENRPVPVSVSELSKKDHKLENEAKEEGQ